MISRFLLTKVVFPAIIVLIAVSCKPDTYTLDDFLTIKKVDTHVHINTESSALAEQAQKDNFLLLEVNVNASVPIDDQERYALIQTKNSPQVVQYVATFSMKGFDSAGWSARTIARLSKSFEHGALGIKLWKNIGMVEKDAAGKFIMIDDPRFDSVIQFVIDHDKTVLGHLGEPKNCWLPVEQMTVNNDRSYFTNHPEYHMFLHPEFPTYDDQINARDRFLERHPTMRFVGAHLGSLEWDVDELAKRLDRFPNMAVDMAARIPHFQHQSITQRDKVRNFIIKYQDRLIYATDSGMSPDSDPALAAKQLHDTWIEDWRYFVSDDMMHAENVNGEFQGLSLPRKVVEKIYFENAVKWFKSSHWSLVISH